MKSALFQSLNSAVKSLPVRGAWIEICNVDKKERLITGRSPCGERGLKL